MEWRVSQQHGGVRCEAGLDALPLLVLVYTPDGTLVMGNTAAETFWGIPREMAGHLNLRDTPGTDETVRDIERAAQECKLIMVQARKIEMPGRSVLWHDMSFVPFYDEQGTAHHVAIMCFDVTESIERKAVVDRAEHLILTQQARIAELEAAKAEILRQRATIKELSTPLIDVWGGILLLPMMGALTEDRMRNVIERLLPAITQRDTRTTIIDLTGITDIDTQTARQMLDIRSMVTLLGAECVLVGIQSSVAQTLAELDLGLDGIRVFATVSSALERCVGVERGALRK